MSAFKYSQKEFVLDVDKMYERISEDEDEQNDLFFDDPILGSVIYKDYDYTLYTPRANVLLPNIEVWELNRPLDEDHVNKIYDIWKIQFKKTKHVSMWQPILIFRIGKVMKIFDGQHRMAALKKLYKNTKQVFDPKICVGVIEGNDSEIGKMIELYQKVNNVKVQDIKYSPTVKLSIIMNEIKNSFTDAIKDNTKFSKRPFVQTQVLKNTLIYYGIIEKCQEDPKKIIKKLSRYNKKFAVLSCSEIFGKTKDEKLLNQQGNIIRKASEINFWLSMRKHKKGLLDWSGIVSDPFVE